MRPFSLLVKPASADCNLRCEYCFYLDRCALYPDSKVHRMSGDALEAMVASYMRTDQPQYAFGWQGGEPTLMGVDFFRRVVDLQQRYGRDGASVANGLQTNGVLLDDEFAAHLARYNFLVGVSLDGPEELHNRFRRNTAGRGSHADVLRGIECLERHRVEYNALVLVSQANVRHGAEVYRYLRDRGILFHQYIPCVEFDEQGIRMPFAISGDEWGEFMCGIFDEWVKQDVRRVSVRLFDSLIGRMAEGVPNVCHMSSNCRQYLVVEHNGDVYPCDFFVEENLRLGNVRTHSWEALQSSPLYSSFGARKTEWNPACGTCEFLQYCLGDCMKHRNEGSRTPSWLCSGWKRFFAHSLPVFEDLAVSVLREREQATRASAPVQPAKAIPRVGRNDPCPCGSGKKYKRCHGSASG